MKQAINRELVRQNFALLAFVIEENMRKVSDAVASGDRVTLGRAFERNKKGIRLQNEIEDLVFDELGAPGLNKRERHRLVLMTHLAKILVRLGQQTVTLADLVEKSGASPDSPEVHCVKRMIDHAVYITDNSLVGMLEENIAKCLVAENRKAGAMTLYTIFFDQAGKEAGVSWTADKVSLVRLVDQARMMVDESSELTDEVKSFLETMKP
jgi:hypothetical protein